MKPVLEEFEHDGQKLFYLCEGKQDAPVITLVNGYARSHTDFRIMVRKLVGSGFRVITLDNRGCGKSVADKPFSLEEMALDIIALWDHLGVSETDLLGISMGGIISQYIARFDNRVEKLILVSTSSSKKHITPDRVEFSTDFNSVMAKMKTYFHPNFVEKNLMLLTAMVKQMIKDAENGGFVEQSKLQRSALDEFDLENEIRLGELDLECLVVHGNEDEVISVRAANEMAEEIKGARKIIYEQCGHLILAEKPLEFYSDVISFLKER